MTGKGTDRKKTKPLPTHDIADINHILAAFKLPESLSGSEIEFPILIKRDTRTNWKEITKENDKWRQEIQDNKENKGATSKPPFINTECAYIQNEVFAYLIPALTETLNKAKKWKALVEQKCFFNGIDHIAQFLWNNNPRYPARRKNNLHLFNMPWVRKQLIKQPREIYPKSWLWSESYAATVIQKSIRRYFVQKEDTVQEMRDFWKRLEVEHQNPDIEMNPLLAKKFASTVLMSNRHKMHTERHGT